MGILTKNDRVDAYMLACYGALKAPEAWLPPPEEVRYLSALLCRRNALVADSAREKTGWKSICAIAPSSGTT